MFGLSGYGISFVKGFANDGKKARWNRDLWDRVSQVLKSAAVGTHRTYRLTISQQSK